MRLFLMLTLLGTAVCISICCGSPAPSSPPNPPTPTFSPTPTNTNTPTLVPTRNANHTPIPSATFTQTPTVTPTPPAWTPTQTFTPIPTTAWSLSFSFGQLGSDGINGDFQAPMGIAVGAGFIAVGDQPQSALGNIQVFSYDGQYLYSIPANQPWGMTLDSYGELYVADLGVSQVNGYYLTRTGYAHDYTWTGQGSVVAPTCVKIDSSGNLLVGDYYGAALVNLSWVDDSVLRQASGSIVWPLDVALDAHGNIFAADYHSNGILVYDPNYVFQSGFSGSAWSPVSQLGIPWGVGTDSQGNVFISDDTNKRVVYASPQGLYLGELIQTCPPTYLTLDPMDDLYVVDYANCCRVNEFVK